MSAKRKYINDEQDATMKLTSDGDLLLKSLLEKQLSKETNLSQELKREREFLSTEYVPVSNFVSGVKSHTEVENAYKYCEELEQMKMAGLSTEDINFYEDSKKGFDHLKIKHKNLDPDYITERMENICSHLDIHKLKTGNIEDSVNTEKGRHWTEFMLSIKPTSIETSLLKFAIKNEKTKTIAVPSTMDNIKNIEKNFMNSKSNEKLPNVSKIRKRARTMKKQIDSIKLEVQEPTNNAYSQNELFVENSKWDQKSSEHNNLKNFVQPKVYGCELKCSANMYTLKEGNIIKIDYKSDVNTIKSKRLTLKEIKEIPKFAQYDPGIPSKILFIKNLPSVSKLDIDNLFKAYNFETESVRIFKGRMRGCAFVELSNSVLAEQALNYMNGIIFMNKPLIIEFGKKRST